MTRIIYNISTGKRPVFWEGQEHLNKAGYCSILQDKFLDFF